MLQTLGKHLKSELVGADGFQTRPYGLAALEAGPVVGWVVPAPVSGYGVTLFWESSEKVFENSCHTCRTCHICPPAKAKREAVQL